MLVRPIQESGLGLGIQGSIDRLDEHGGEVYIPTEEDELQALDEDDQFSKTMPLKTTSLNLGFADNKMSFSFGISEVKPIDKTALGARNKFNISPSRAFVIGRLD
jgi:hypothetical protein